MQIKHKESGGTLFINMAGELDQHVSAFVRAELDRLFTETRARQIILNLAELAFIDSTGIGVFIGRYKKLKARGIPVFISAPSMHADKIFKISGIYTIMPKIG